MKKRTKIIATIGPASSSLQNIKDLIKAGVNVFRLNFSHGTHADHEKVLANIREAMKSIGLIVGILQDISGPKIRVGMLEEDFYLKLGDTIKLTVEDIVGKAISENHYELSINQKNIINELEVGNLVYMYDGIIKTKVSKKNSDSLELTVLNDGKLSSKKGVNFPNKSIGIEVLTQKDKDDIAWGAKNQVDFMAISFVQNGNDMKQARQLVKSHGADISLIAKIEKFDAVLNIDDILEHSDGLMVARGDLGIEVPFYEVPNIQKMLIKKANEASKPVITATQMMLSMTSNDSATRAEISDVANAVLDGTDAVMLSEESAIGKHPVLVVETMVQTIKNVEKIYPYNKFSAFEHQDDMDIIDESAVRLARDLDAKGLLTLTSSGQSAKKIARYRPSQDIYAITHNHKIASSLTIVWGVVPAFLIKKGTLDEMLCEVATIGLKNNSLDESKRYILTAGNPIGVPGTTNSIRILRDEELKYFRNLKRK